MMVKKKHPELFPQATHAPGKQKPPCYLDEGMVAEQSFYPLLSSLFLQANVCKINENNRF
jgi:hypothetical protein